jgi:hypothetical protein
MIVTVEPLELLCGEVGALEVVPPVAGVDPVVEGEPELPHAASRAAPPAKIGAAHHRLRMVIVSVPRCYCENLPTSTT